MQTIEIPGIKIFRYSGSLNFACRQYFREEIYKVAELVPQKELYRRLKAATIGSAEAEEIKKVIVNIKLILENISYLPRKSILNFGTKKIFI